MPARNTRTLLRATWKVWLIRLLLATPRKIENTIVLTGVPRSGTTWLAEILACLPRAGILFEPLFLRRVPEAISSGFEWSTDIDPDDRDPERIAFMQRVLSGQLINPWIARDLRVPDCIGLDRLIVKFVRAENMLDWLALNFPIPRPLFVIRHPCAVVASQLTRNWSGFATKEAVMAEPALRRYSHLQEAAESAQTPEECLAAKWCLKNYKALFHSEHRDIVIYERLVMDGEQQLTEIFATLGLAVPERALERLAVPSATTHGNRPEMLTGWHRQLNPKQIESILRVTRDFNMNFYSAEPEPDYQALLEIN